MLGLGAFRSHSPQLALSELSGSPSAYIHEVHAHLHTALFLVPLQSRRGGDMKGVSALLAPAGPLPWVLPISTGS